jgi:single-stranded DNA-binding protein
MPDTFVSLIGKLTDDPEVRFTPGGTQVGSFRLAVTPASRTGRAGRTGRPRSSASTSGATWPPTPPTRWPRATA